MKTQPKIFIGIGVVVLLFIGYAATSDSPSQEINVATSNDTQANQEEIENTETNTITLVTDQTELAESGKYLPYDADVVANSDAEHIVLSFSATWCPSCRTLDKDINDNLGNIPAGTEIYKVDYDTNVALRQKYGVTMQHTQVIIDKDGNLIKKWSGGNTLEQFLAQI